MKVYYEKDADLSLIKGRKVCIVGYGSQGHAHALNLNDSGVKVVVAVRKGGPSWDKAKKAGLKVAEIGEAVKGADFVMMLMPDEHIAATYKSEVEPNIKQGATLAFAHGFNIHYHQVAPRADGQSLLTQTAYFAPKGLMGWLYWNALYPLHGLIFSGLIDRIAMRAADLKPGRP